MDLYSDQEPVYQPTSSELVMMMSMNTLGMAILKDALERLAFPWTNSSTLYMDQAMAQSDALMFIQGTGLDNVIEDYHIALDPTEIRRTFFYMFRKRKLIDEYEDGL